MKCDKCGEFHDVEEETRVSGSGHSYVQANTIWECDKAQFPDDEAFQDKQTEYKSGWEQHIAEEKEGKRIIKEGNGDLG